VSVDAFIEGAQLVMTWRALVFIFVGVFLGLILGATPGIGPVPGIALLLPLTIEFEPWVALSMLFAIYIGGMYGGAVTAILLNVPGTAGAIASTFDGYPLSLQGRANYAIEVSVLASSFGTILSAVVLILAMPFLIQLISLFGTVEYALIAVFGITIIPLVSQDSVSKALLMGGFGTLLSTVGMPVMTANPRFTLGIIDLNDGVAFVPVLLGIFAIAEMLKLVPYEGTLDDSGGGSDGPDGKAPATDGGYRTVRKIPDRLAEIFVRNPLTFLKSVSIAMIVGLIPAAGGAVSNILAYALEKGTASDSETFGTGNIRGLISAESANSGTIASTLVPLLGFGIPGSPTAAVILGGMLMHGVNPGPGLFQESVHLSYATFTAVAIGGVFLIVIGLLTATQMARLTRLRMSVIVPPIVVLCFVGSYALALSFVDVAQAFLTGLVGYLLIKYNYSIVALIMGLILGPIIEENVHRALSLGDVWIFVGTPLRLLLVGLIVASLVGPVAMSLTNRDRSPA
jgi:putative tricarboxylic transport membrane protein